MFSRMIAFCTLLAAGGLFAEAASGEPLPHGAAARLGSTRFRVGDARYALAVSPDGKLLLSGGEASLRLWNRATGEQVRAITLPAADCTVHRVVFSPDGKYFAAVGRHWSRTDNSIGSDYEKSVFVGEIAGGKLLHAFRGLYTSVAFSPDGTRLFGHGLNSRRPDVACPVVVWDVVSGKEQRKFPNVLSFVLSPNGKILAGGDLQGTVYVWDAQSGEERCRMEKHGGPVRVLAFAPDGRTLAVANDDPFAFKARSADEENKLEFRVRLWDVDSGKERLTSQRYAREIKRLAFAADGKTFVVVDADNSLYLRDAVTGRLRQRFPDDSRSGDYFLYSPDGKWLIYQGSDDCFHQWDVVAGKESRRWPVPKRGSNRYLFSADGKTLFAVGEVIRAWDFATLAEENLDADHRAPLGELIFSADGKSLATLDWAQRLRVWDSVRGRVYPALDSQGVVRCAFTPDGRRLIRIGQDMMVTVQEVPSGRLLRRFRVGNGETRRLWASVSHSDSSHLGLSETPDRCCVFDGERRLLAVADADQCIHLWDVMRGEELRRCEGHRGLLETLRFTPDGKRLLSISTDNTLRLWDAGSGRELQRFQEDDGAALHFALSADGRLLAWVGNGRIHLWDLPAGKEIGTLKGHGIETGQVFVERDGGVVFSAGRDGMIRCWDSRGGRELRAIAVEKDSHFRLFAVPAGRVLALAAADSHYSKATLYEAGTGQALFSMRSASYQPFALAPDGKTVVAAGAKLVFREAISGGIGAETPMGHRGLVRCLAFSPDGKRLASGGEDTTVVLWDWRRLTGLDGDNPAALGDRERASAWTDLASPEARRAYRAIGVLTAGGDKSVSLLRQRLPAATARGRTLWQRRLEELEDADFAVREKATQELTNLGVEAFFFLNQAATKNLPLETRRRLRQILSNDAIKRPSAASLRAIRAVQVLEAMASPAARELLTDWSHGDADAWLTQEAKAALTRLDR